MAYKEMAALYDALMTHAPYEDWIRFTEEVFKASGKEINSVVDLGCGTGEITIPLAQLGYQTTGIDYSLDMLSYAEHKASQANTNIQWLHQDIRNLTGLENIDAAVSYCDVVNYVTDEADLQQTFQGVYDLLTDEGIFLFDVHDLTFITENYIGQTFADVTDEVSYIWFCTAGDSTGDMYHDLTFFAESEQGYVRFDEQHHQKVFSIEFYKKILFNAGFENVKVSADFDAKFKNPSEKAARIFFLAIKTPR